MAPASGSRDTVPRCRAAGGARARLSQRGQASVEFVAAVPLVLLVAMVVWQLALAGQAGWLCANAARVAARAAAVDGDPRAAALSALPRSLAGGVRVDGGSGRVVRVRLRVPLLHPRWRSPVEWQASASLGPQP